MLFSQRELRVFFLSSLGWIRFTWS